MMLWYNNCTISYSVYSVVLYQWAGFLCDSGYYDNHKFSAGLLQEME